MNSQLNLALSSLLHTLVTVRCALPDVSSGRYWAVFGTAQGQIRALVDLGVITLEQGDLLSDLLMNASEHGGKPFPSTKNVGPVMPYLIALKRSRSAVEPQAEQPADEPASELPAPAAPRAVRLLCLLVQTRNGKARTLPVHTLRPMPPRVCAADSHDTDGQDRWCLDNPRLGMGSDTGLYLRETHAIVPPAEVLERCTRYGQTNALRADLRAVRAGGLSQ
jgi:hypothetical protein